MELVFPMFVMVVLTFIVALATAVKRIKGASSGEIDPRYFKLISSYEIPESTAKLGKNLDNLFQVPTLFYAGCCTAIALNLNNTTLLMLTWAFVVFRLIHSTIHITYNHPLHRFLAFLLSFLSVMGIWICVVTEVTSRL